MEYKIIYGYSHFSMSSSCSSRAYFVIDYLRELHEQDVPDVLVPHAPASHESYVLGANAPLIVSYVQFLLREEDGPLRVTGLGFGAKLIGN
ncbi:unnamed protein product [Caenorhabditis nigoni]